MVGLPGFEPGTSCTPTTEPGSTGFMVVVVFYRLDGFGASASAHRRWPENRFHAHFRAHPARLKDALAHFETVVNQDERHSQSEILREIGAVYVSARQYEDARLQLAEYSERRPYDAEGLFYYGQALEGVAKVKEAGEAFGRASEAASLTPPYLRRAAAKWGRLARKQKSRLGQ